MPKEPTASDFKIERLGEATHDSPLVAESIGRKSTPRFIAEEDQILLHDHAWAGPAAIPEEKCPTLELAGPRHKIFFNPSSVGVGIVTCGGLCPGLNDVIRGLVMESYYRYGIRRILGFQYGYRGLTEHADPGPLELDPELVSEIHETGGSALRSSRGPQDPKEIVDNLVRLGVNILFTIGGDGTLRGALAICEEIKRRGLPIAVIGIPKTIDNDIQWLDQSFGFETAFAMAVDAIKCAHNEARGTLNGIGLVKVMGRLSGFLACHAALATSHVNFVIIPEMPFDAKAQAAFLKALKRRLERRRHAVILVAEGSAQEALQADVTPEKDASGNVKLTDVGQYLTRWLSGQLTAEGMEHSMKYIDPSYMVRSVPAAAGDSVYCWQLAQNAVHAAMAGKTGMIVGRWHGRLAHIPIRMAISERKLVDPQGDLWLSVLETTGQPAVFE